MAIDWKYPTIIRNVFSSGSTFKSFGSDQPSVTLRNFTHEIYLEKLPHLIHSFSLKNPQIMNYPALDRLVLFAFMQDHI